MRRLLIRAVVAVLVFAGSGFVFAQGTAGAAALRQSAWWHRATTETPLGTAAPAPPTVSAEQLHVEGTAAGAVAIAGFTYDLVEGESGPILTLTAAAGSAVPPNAVILACRAAIEWTAPETSPGAWDAKPLADCATSVQGQIVDDGAAVVFPLQPLVRGTALDVLIVPGTIAELPAGANGSVFSLTFSRPGPEALATTPPPSSGGDTAGSDASVAFDDDFSYEAPVTPADVFVAPEPTATFDDVVVAPTDPIVEPALEPQDQAPSVPRAAAPAAVSMPADAGNAARTLGFVILVLGAIAALVVSSERQPSVAALGLGRLRRDRSLPSDATDDVVAEERGVGRLRRARTGRAPSL